MNGSTSTSQNGLPTKQRQLLPESLPLLQEGILLIFSRWSALQLAVENEWGGRGSRQLADQFASNIFSWFTQSKEPLYLDDLEEKLDEGMLSLNTEIDDGSIEEVAEELMIMHEEILDGNHHTIEKLRQAGSSPGAHQHIRQPTSDDEDDDEDDSMDNNSSSMMVDEPKFQSIPHQVNMQVGDPRGQVAQGEDGWTVVSSKKNRDKRN